MSALATRGKGIHFLLVLAFATLLAISSTVIAVPEARSATPSEFGFASINTLTNDSDLQLAAELDTIVNAGGKWIRVVVQWQAIEWQRGTFDWQSHDRVIDAATQRGLKVLGLIVGPAPAWAQNVTDTGYGMAGAPPADPATFGTFARAAAAHYVDSVTSWELWNEPNLPEFFSPAPDVGKYVALLKAGFNGIHAIQPYAVVLSGGLSTSRGASSIPPATFLQQMYQQGAKEFMDAVAAHPYTIPYSIADDPNNGWGSISDLRNMMIGNGDAAKKIWVTEFGFPTGTTQAEAVSEDNQAAYLVDALSRSSTTDYLGPTFIYTVRDNSADPAILELNFGIVRYTGLPKPAFFAIQKYAKAALPPQPNLFGS
jgi:polysaccharide biosynthesis protein PslG